jgi:hypothetical protein
MKIVMRDGRVFQGTAVQIVQAMQSIAFGVETFTLDQYIDWVIDNARRFEGIELRAQGQTEDARAGALVAAMLDLGLATRG